MRGKPIEPGCTAMVVGSIAKENNGRTVKVEDRWYPGFVPENMPFGVEMGGKLDDQWIVSVGSDQPPLTLAFKDKYTKALLPNLFRKTRRTLFGTHQLIRLDDDEPLEEQETSQEKTNAAV